MVQSDALTRNTPTHTADDNVDLILLPDEVFAEQHMRSLHIATKLLEMYDEQPRHGSVDDKLEQLIICHMKDDAYAKTIHQYLDNPLLTLPAQTTPEDWRKHNNLLFFQGRCYVPSDLHLRRKIVVLHHDPPVAGHPGRFRTAELVSKDFFWPGLQFFVSSFVQGCP